MYRTLTGKEAAEAVLINVKRRALALSRKPALGIILVGKDPASEVYVSNKIRKAEYSGIQTNLHKLPENVKEDEVIALVNKLNEDEHIDGYIVQSPLPKQVDEKKILEAITPEKDVDGWTTANLGNMFVGNDIYLPATPAGIVRLLEYYNVKIQGRNAVVVGRSNVVGKPAAMLLLRKNATVTICHSKTENLADYTKKADILIVAAGKAEMITGDMVKKGAVVIDVGINKSEKGIVGDVKFDDVIKKADCSPVPGGVGLMTVAMLLDNVVKAAEKNVGTT